MRIRKAVPEGYKTHKTALFNDPTPAKAAITSPTSFYGYSRPAGELMPFCGLHRIGGLSVQPVNAQAEIDIFSDDMPFNLSQESTTSTLSTDPMPAGPHPSSFNLNKRRLEDEENEEQEDSMLGETHDITFDFSMPFDLSASPPHAGYSATHTSLPDMTAVSGTRPMAKPKSRRKGVSALVEDAAPGFDFEDADFLVWDEEMAET
jgi:hypothetical protein